MIVAASLEAVPPAAKSEVPGEPLAFFFCQGPRGAPAHASEALGGATPRAASGDRPGRQRAGGL